ncbi:15528_t:CDS:2 [Funneliformis geosporum]|uniref:15528_t:CDS:1 n=1 Tax=Funneliformis geosporum TaxID=1117311 RepID=A0A9W4SV65_9GLOM|nr:15528_t:CDS:2 [Funneliformis geosporum]
MLTGKDLDDVDVKIVKYLVRDPTLSTEIQKYKVGELKQGNESHALEEHEARFTNLEQKDKEKTTLIAKLDDDIREIKQEQNAKFSIVTEAEKKKWDREQFLTALENDKKLYRKVIERKRDDPLMIDPRKYYPFLTDRDRLIGEELMRRSMIERRFKTGWLDDNIKKWEDTHTQFIEIFALT